MWRKETRKYSINIYGNVNKVPNVAVVHSPKKSTLPLPSTTAIYNTLIFFSDHISSNFINSRAWSENSHVRAFIHQVSTACYITTRCSGHLHHRDLLNNNNNKNNNHINFPCTNSIAVVSSAFVDVFFMRIILIATDEQVLCVGFFIFIIIINERYCRILFIFFFFDLFWFVRNVHTGSYRCFLRFSQLWSEEIIFSPITLIVCFQIHLGGWKNC
jgi:hypothetical protein